MSYFQTGILDSRDLLVIEDIPDVIKTNRMSAEIPKAADGAPLFTAIAESIIEFRKWPTSLPWAQMALSQESCELWCRTCRANFVLRWDFQFLMRASTDANRSILGNVAIHSLDLDHGVAEVGYWVRSSAVRNGYATEGLAAISQWAYSRLGIRKLRCNPEAANEASLRLARRLGFVEVCRTQCGGVEHIDMCAALTAEGLRPAEATNSPL